MESAALPVEGSRLLLARSGAATGVGSRASYSPSMQLSVPKQGTLGLSPGSVEKGSGLSLTQEPETLTASGPGPRGATAQALRDACSN